jgi:hypothetical protein
VARASPKDAPEPLDIRVIAEPGQHKQGLLEASQEPCPTAGAASAPLAGTVKATMIFVDFSDAPAPTTETTSSLYNALAPGATSWFTPLETSGGTKIVVVKTSATRAIVAEDRQALGVDTAACAAGVLIYTVDTTIATGNGPILVQDAHPGSGGCAGAELNGAPFGFGTGQNSNFRDTVSGVSVTVSGQQGSNYTISVTL